MLTTLTKVSQAETPRNQRQRGELRAQREGAISRHQEKSDIELRIRDLLQGDIKLEGGVGRTLVELDQWITMVHSEGLDKVLTRAAQSESLSVEDLMHRTVDRLTEEAQGIERHLLQKSLLETLFISGLKPERQRSQFVQEFTQFLATHGAGEFLRRFLSFHVFNVIWFQTSDAFRADSRTHGAFLKNMEMLEQVCDRVVDGIWKTHEPQRPLTSSSVFVLVDEIARSLCGV
jgi:hypothetical protein